MGDADVGVTPELVQSKHVTSLESAGIAFDQPLENVMKAAKAADEADKSGKARTSSPS